MSTCCGPQAGRADEEIWTKIHSFSHAAEVKPDWYERVWKGWDADHTIEKSESCIS